VRRGRDGGENRAEQVEEEDLVAGHKRGEWRMGRGSPAIRRAAATRLRCDRRRPSAARTALFGPANKTFSAARTNFFAHTDKALRPREQNSSPARAPPFDHL